MRYDRIHKQYQTGHSAKYITLKKMALVAKYLGAGKKSVLLTSLDGNFSIKLIQFDGEVMIIDKPDNLKNHLLNLNEILKGVYKLEIIEAE